MIIISRIYKAHLISQRTSQCASLLSRYQENRHNHFASTREQLAKCMPYLHLDSNIFPRTMPPWCAQVNETNENKVPCLNTQHASPVSCNMMIFFGFVQISIWGPIALKASALTNWATVPLNEGPLGDKSKFGSKIGDIGWQCYFWSFSERFKSRNLKKKVMENGKNDQFVDEIETKSSFLWQPNAKK